MNKITCFLFTCLVALSSCKKKNTPVITTSPTTYPSVDGVLKTMGLYSCHYNNNNPSLVDSIYYDNMGRIIAIYGDSLHTDFVYTGNNITMVKRYIPDGKHTDLGSDSVFYTGLLIDSVFRFNNGVLTDVYRTKYSGTQTIQRDVDFYFPPANIMRMRSSYYKYDSAGNLSSVKQFDHLGNLVLDCNLFYGSNVNMLKDNAAFRCSQNVLGLTAVTEALSYSPQLPDSIVYMEQNWPTVSGKVSYDLSANGYPMNVYVNGNMIMVFRY